MRYGSDTSNYEARIGRTTMKLLGTFVIALTLSLLAAGAAVAQQLSHEHSAPSQQPAAAPKPAMPSGGDQAHQIQHIQHMEMCRQMMMGQPGMMGMMPMMMGWDPKQPAEMLAMRREMMKAMGEILMKYA